ncbi:MAG: biotin/lipoyl-containing protein, partial [Saprospiraceae bacterium]|nr:biotin/lipoyl-containing protein [Saprospiraceae bacterium]
MLHEYKLPSLGDGVSGKVTEILVKTGDKVSPEQIVIVVGTDKVDAEMPIDVEGVVEEILVKKGDEVSEGSLVMKIKTEAASDAASAPAAEASPTKASTPEPEVAKTLAPAPESAPEQKAPATAPTPSAPTSSSSATLRTSPQARKRAKELGVNLAEVRPAEGANRLSYKDGVDFV